MTRAGGADADDITGESGADMLKGWGGDDTLDGVDGVNGNDVVKGAGGDGHLRRRPGRRDQGLLARSHDDRPCEGGHAGRRARPAFVRRPRLPPCSRRQLRGWDGEFVATRFDEPSGSWFLVGVHSTVLGPGLGGTRMKVYDERRRAGARRAPALPRDDVQERDGAAPVRGRQGRARRARDRPPVTNGTASSSATATWSRSLRGAYVTACDMNTAEHDMDVIVDADRARDGDDDRARRFGDERARHRARASTTASARPCGTRSGATIRRAGRSPIQGAGAVGQPARRAPGRGRRRRCWSPTSTRRGPAAVAAAVGGTAVGPDEIVTAALRRPRPVRDRRRPRRRSPSRRSDAPIVAGAANNQLAADEDGERLREAGVLYAPDYVVNAGGVLHLAGHERLGWSEDEVRTRIEGIGGTLAEVFDRAEADGVATSTAARPHRDGPADGGRGGLGEGLRLLGPGQARADRAHRTRSSATRRRSTTRRWASRARRRARAGRRRWRPPPRGARTPRPTTTCSGQMLGDEDHQHREARSPRPPGAAGRPRRSWRRSPGHRDVPRPTRAATTHASPTSAHTAAWSFRHTSQQRHPERATSSGRGIGRRDGW